MRRNAEEAQGGEHMREGETLVRFGSLEMVEMGCKICKKIRWWSYAPPVPPEDAVCCNLGQKEVV